MMAQVIKQPDRYLTTPPDIMLIPKAYIDVIKNQYNPDVFDIVKIENGSDKKRHIQHILWSPVPRTCQCKFHHSDENECQNGSA